MKNSARFFPSASAWAKASIVAVAAFAFTVTPAIAARIHVKISAPAAAIDAYQNWTAGVAWDQITNFKNANAMRPVVDLVLELQALKAGGLDFDFELVRTLTYDLAKKQLAEGRVELTAETIWETEIDSSLMLKTDAVIRHGEFVKGVYVLPGNQKLLGISSLGELQANTGGVVATWGLDVKTMEEMKLKALTKSPTPEVIFTNIQKQQVDFVLWEFSNNADMSVVLAGVKLVPVPNSKVAIMGSRAWVVSKASPNADAVYKALAAGTKILRDNGTIERAYKESGFHNPRVADWKRLF
ncbi:MAG TPA: hypothetical protein VHO24_19485 [Opitutaceae bacterium]|nr:hypothetical protein [Opitutaceae bacterium]